MNVVRIDERDADWARVRGYVDTGVTVLVMRGRQVFAIIAAGECDRTERPAPHPSWKEAGIDWDEIALETAMMPYDPSNSVEEMRREARY